ncbi:MFS transporter [Polymorphospora rubra]|uniref:MFS transporter n=1 Tax=Polymorphospora rubra TaxID=338584 RepID=UPI003CCEC2C4
MRADDHRSRQPRAGHREWLGLAVLALPCLLVSMDLTVLNLAVPHLSADLRPSGSQLLWIVDIYGFLIAGSLIAMGTLGDRVGRRRLLLIGGAAFGAASLLAAFSTSAEMLILARALLGVAGATLMPSTLSLIRTMFHDPAQRTLAIGIWTISFSLGAVIGPLVGGVLLERFWWGSVFLVGVPVMVLLLALGPALLPEYRNPAAGRFDLLSAAMSVVAVLAVIYGIKQIAEGGPAWTAVVSIVAGAVVAVLFGVRQRRLADPLLDLRLFHRVAFSASLAAQTLAFLVAFGTLFLIAQYLQLVVGLSPLAAGLWTVPSSIGFIAGAMAGPALATRLRPGYVMGAGLACAAIGFAVLTQVEPGGGVFVPVVASVVFCVGLAPVYILATDLMVSTAPEEEAGAASAISEAGSEFGTALGIAILGSVSTAVYRGIMADTTPVGVGSDAAGSARDTLGGAVAVAEELPGPLGAELLDAARDAFARALEVTAVISVVLTVAMCAVAVVALRTVRTAPAKTD